MTLPDDDVGLAAERTTLAWQRTALAYAVTAAVALRVVQGTASRIAVATGLLLAATVAAAGGRGVARESPRRQVWLRALAGGTVAAAALGLGSALLPLDGS